ncbi:helix-turn-helix domain-containing protein [Cellulosilyticum sp. I15G10I2]|uniref:helix-turn-helix domain-containing protein n=1 Tax=Cellulosilyticum sp. I15G10I2 TaxID=1892843 RepID=UPI00085C446A|nr:AraC family transcriptional regulator [Cellulosilyticum sp. I15G10I2]
MSFLKKTKKMFMRTYTTLLLTLLIPMIIFMTSFFINYAQSRKANLDSYHLLKSKSLGIFTAQVMNNLESDLLKLDSSRIFKIYPTENIRPDIDSVLLLLDELVSFKLKHDYIDSMYYYHSTTDFLFIDKTGTNDIQLFYDTEWIEQLDPSLKLQRLPIRRIESDPMFKKAMPLSFTQNILTLAVQLAPNRYILANISVNKLASYINKYTMLPGEAYAISSHKEEMLFAIPALDTFIDDPENTAINTYQYALPYNGWVGTLYVSHDALRQDMAYLMWFIIINIFLLLVISFILAIFATRYIYKPIKSLNEEIQEHITTSKKDYSDEIEFFRDMFNRLETENQRFQSQAYVYQDSLNQYAFKDFIHGTLTFQAFSERMLSSHLNISAPYYQLLLISSELQNAAMPINADTTFNILSVLNAYIQNLGTGLTLLMDQYFVILIGAEEKANIASIAQSVIRISQESFNIGKYVGKSDVFSQLTQVPDTYNNTLSSVQYYKYIGTPKEFLCSCDKAQISFRYSSASKIQDKLVNAVSLNDFKEIELHTHQFIEHLMKLDSLDLLFKVTFILIATLETKFTLNEILDFNVYHALENTENINELENIIIKTCTQIAMHNKLEKLNENIYVNQAKQFIHDHYKEGISVSQVADSLNISYPYLSKLFKEMESQNIADYINEIRIEEGKKLLISSNLTVKEIAVEVGYSNHQSFERYFKKYNDLAPGQYRKLNVPT